MPSPIGPLHLVERDGVLCELAFDDRFAGRPDASPGRARAAPALAAYFAGELAALESIDTAGDAGTPFQRAVWRELRRIPCGQTASYADVARALGKPSATRAVGAANGQNPIAVVVPCHRVIGASGKLTGYGGGLPRKRWLLAHEGAIAAPLLHAGI